jgi:hypothetical protein
MGRLEKRILIWLQIVGIIGAAAWAVYTFIFKEILAPKTVPVNTSLAVELKPGQSTAPASHDGRVPLSISASATNPSVRKVHLLHSVWVMYGYRLRDSTHEFDRSTVEHVMNTDDDLQLASRFSDVTEISLIAGGNLFDDDELSPQEHISRTDVVYVPSHTYDAVEVLVIVPSAVDADDLSLTWKFIKPQSNSVEEPESTVTSIKTNKELDYRVLHSREYAEASSRVKISF